MPARRGQNQGTLVVARSQEGTGGDPQKTEKHTALKAAPTPNTTANMPCQAALPEASFSGGRRDGAAGREEERCHPADASHDPPPCHSPLRIPVHPKLPGPQLGRGGHLRRAPMFLETPVSPRADREPGPLPALPGLTRGPRRPERPAHYTGLEGPQDPGMAAGRGKEGALRGCSQGRPATTYQPDSISLSFQRTRLQTIKKDVAAAWLGAQKVLPRECSERAREVPCVANRTSQGDGTTSQSPTPFLALNPSFQT